MAKGPRAVLVWFSQKSQMTRKNLPKTVVLIMKKMMTLKMLRVPTNRRKMKRAKIEEEWGQWIGP